jgi:hypothetical protein
MPNTALEPKLTRTGVLTEICNSIIVFALMNWPQFGVAQLWIVRRKRMIPFSQIVLAALDVVDGALKRKKPKTAEEIKRQRILRRNERAMMFFVVFCVILCAVLFFIMAFR